jgi:carbamoyltransferase
MWILGYHGPPIGWHDGSVCLVDGDGKVWAFAEHERFSRTKHAIRESPIDSVDHCLAVAGITRHDIDVVAVGWDLPVLYTWLKGTWTFDTPRDLLVKELGWDTGRGGKLPDVQFFSHHRTHASSAFYASGFEEAAVLVIDGQGEDEGTSIFTAKYGEPVVRRDRWPTSASIGFMYEGACRAIGLDFLEAGKTMGLASYGRDRVSPELLLEWTGDTYRPPFEVSDDATYKEVLAAWETALSARFADLPRSTPRDLLHEDDLAVRVAFSAQATVEDIVPRLAELARRSTGIENLCVAGGVGLNCSVNGMLAPPIYVPPVAYDAGAALGAAWLVAPPSAPGAPLDPFLGRAIAPNEVADPALANGLGVEALDVDDVVRRLLDGQVGALAWGRAEIGARALGHRSIIALPNRREVADHVNRLKSRELWRPLAPVGLASVEGDLWKEHPLLHKYMLGAVDVTERGRELIPATVHVDGSARAQIVDESDPGPLAAILRGVEAAGHPPVVMNTSFNGRGEPIVNTAKEALATFGKLGLDFLVSGDVLVSESAGL